MNSKQYKEIIRPFLSDKRFRHSVYVAEECIALAKRRKQSEFYMIL